MTRYHSSCIELIRMHSVMFQLVGLIISHQYELYLLLNSHFQADIIKNDTYFFWVKAKNIYIIFLVLLKRKSVLFFSNRSLWINPPKIFFKHFFQRKKTWKKGVWISIYGACYPSITTTCNSCTIPFFFIFSQTFLLLSIENIILVLLIIIEQIIQVIY